MCCKHKLLPSSYTIINELERVEEFPSSGGGSADVFCGWYRDSKVAIKRIRHSLNRASVERVRLPVYLFQNTDVLTRETEILPRGSIMEAVQTPEPITAARGNQNLAYPHDGFRMDGTRDNHELRHRISRNQSIEAGKRSLMPEVTINLTSRSWQTSPMD